MAKDCTEWSVKIEQLVLILIFNCTFPCHAHLYGIVLLYFVVACVRGLIHNIVITLLFIIDGIISDSIESHQQIEIIKFTNKAII